MKSTQAITTYQLGKVYVFARSGRQLCVHAFQSILCRMRSVLLRVLLRVSFLLCLFLCTYVVQCLWYMFITSVKLHTRRWSSKAVFLSVTVTSPIGDIGSYASCRQLASFVIKGLTIPAFFLGASASEESIKFANIACSTSQIKMATPTEALWIFVVSAFLDISAI